MFKIFLVLLLMTQRGSLFALESPVVAINEAEDIGKFLIKAEIYRFGLDGEEINIPKSIEFYEKATKVNNPKALYDYGMVKLERNEEIGIKLLTSSALLGWHPAQRTLGDIYRTGYMFKVLDSIKIDIEEAKKWYELAAAQGNDYAMFELGRIYETIDKEKAIDLLKNSASKGNRLASIKLYDMNKNDGKIKEILYFMELSLDGAKNGSDYAQQFVTYHYYNGTFPLNPNYNEAFFWAKKSADQNNKQAQYYLAKCYRKGRGTTKNENLAIKWFTKAAERGNYYSQFNLGEIYYKNKNYEKAFKYLTAATDHVAEANFYLGKMYEHTNKGVLQDIVKAFEYYSQALNFKEGCYKRIRRKTYIKLAKFYEEGIVVQKNIAKAFELYIKGDNNYKLGRYFLSINDRKTANEYFRKKNRKEKDKKKSRALMGYNVKLFENYGDYYDKKKKFKESIFWYTRITGYHTNSKMYNILGYNYQHGEGVDINYQKAFEYYSKAAEYNYRIAQFNLGELYELGLGVHQNDSEAINWYTKSALQNDKDAKNAIIRIYKEGRGKREDYNPVIGQSWFSDIKNTQLSISQQLKIYKIAPKYIEGGRDVPKLRSGNLQSDQKDFTWLENPQVKLKPIYDTKQLSSYIKIDPEKVRNIPLQLQTVNGNFYTLMKNQDLNNIQRVTFILSGRNDDAYVPIEEDTGRVIFIAGPDFSLDHFSHWIGPNRDVFVIKEMKGIDFNQLGLVANRRHATMALAQKFDLKNFIMLDDNLESIYASLELLKDAGSWKSLYLLFKNAAEKNNLFLLSARTFRPELDKFPPNAKEFTLNSSILGSKIFYFDRTKMANKRIELTNLFPAPICQLWGEDIWMQLYLMHSDLDVGILDREVLIFKRAMKKSGNKDICALTVRKSNEWLNEELKNSLLDYSKDPLFPVVYKQMVEVTKNAVEDLKKYKEKLKIKDPSSAAKKLARKKAIKREASDDDKPLENTSNKKEKLDLTQTNPKKEKKLEFLSMEKPESEMQNLEERNSQLISLYESNKQNFHQMLRPHQVNAMEHWSLTLKANKKSGYFNMATGTGKTNIFLTLTALAQKVESMKNLQTVIIVPTQDLVQQVEKEIVKKYNTLLENNLLSELRISPADIITVSSYVRDTNQRALSYMDAGKSGRKVLIFCEDSFKNYMINNPKTIVLMGQIIIDEFHTTSTQVLDYVSKSVIEYPWIQLWGFSATPNKKKMYFDKKSIFTYGTNSAINDRVLRPWIIDSIPNSIPVSEIPQLLKNKFHPNGKLLMELKGIIWVKTIQQAEEMSKHLHQEKIPHYVVYSEKDKQKDNPLKNQEKIKRFTKNYSEKKLLVAVNKLITGFDSNVDYCIVLRKMKQTSNSWIQMRGRLLRRDPRLQGDQLAYILSYENNLPQKNALCPFTEKHLGEFSVSPDYLAQQQCLGIPLSKEEIMGEMKKTKPYEVSEARWYQEEFPQPMDISDDKINEDEWINSFLIEECAQNVITPFLNEGEIYDTKRVKKKFKKLCTEKHINFLD